MTPEEPQGSAGISRRRMLGRMGAGVAVAWSAPILTSVRIPAHAQVSPACRFVAKMDGSQEVPPVPSPGTGTADFVRTAPDTVDYTYTYQDLTSGVNGAHIHRAPPGQNGPIVIPLAIIPGSTEGSVSDTAQADPALLDEICANPGAFYINVHTDLYPGGEIRGQLVGG
ncbi:MAG: CHRD domain-containing protein [Actinomycetota bacterium]